jgi:NAD(P)-dependent dehydrogenase (short-subunit alcohol dehydrogenase family)
MTMKASKSLQNRSALITGSSQGIGRTIAEEFLRQGASVALCARDAALLAQTAAALGPWAGPGQRIVARACDVSRKDQVESLVGWAVEELPGLDILVNSAGIYGPKGPLEDNDWDDWVRTIEIDLLGAALLFRGIIPHLKKRGSGKIIQLSGGGATAPLARISAYAASKAGVVRLVETLAVELGPHHIEINSIAPGALNTRMLDEVLAAGPQAVGEAFYQRALQQKETGGAPLGRGAELAVFLASRASDGITGRLISAVWDQWEELAEHRDELASSDIFTLRRILPGDRGKAWK